MNPVETQTPNTNQSTSTNTSFSSFNDFFVSSPNASFDNSNDFVFVGSGPLEAEVNKVDNITNVGFQTGMNLKQLIVQK